MMPSVDRKRQIPLMGMSRKYILLAMLLILIAIPLLGLKNFGAGDKADKPGEGGGEIKITHSASFGVYP